MNMRTDFLNKLKYILSKTTILCNEDSNKGLLHNHKLSKSIADVSWASFVNKLEYKREMVWQNNKNDRLYPSSQICSVCGHRMAKKLDISGLV